MTAARGLAVVSILLLAIGSAPAAEITSNGKGGGAWSNPATWLGQNVPGADDDAVIQKGDIIDFDRDDDGKVTCRKLLIDPRGAFRFKTGQGKITCCLAGPVEARGLIQLDGTKSANDSLELRLVGSERNLRAVQLLKGAALVVRGRADLPDGRRNVALTSPKVGHQKEEIEATVADGRLTNGRIQGGVGGTVIDLQRANLENVIVMADGLDNTGSRSNEQVNIVDNRFSGRARLWLERCDTPLIRKNSFEYPGPKRLNASAIFLADCPLAEVRGNTMRGFQHGLYNAIPKDCTVVGNTAEQCDVGYFLSGGSNASLSQNSARDCDCAYHLHFTEMATLEECRVDGGKLAVRTCNSSSQIISMAVSNLAKDGVGLLYDAHTDGSARGSVVLVNCNIRSEAIKFTKPPTDKSLPVTALHCLVVAAKEAPAGATVEVRTAGAAPGAADPNVRNSPAPLSKGLTPLPVAAGTARDALPLIVKGWSIDTAGKTLAAPEYEVRVLGPDGKLLKSLKAKPEDSWFRAKPDDPTPTVEVTLK
jgi:Right handed beta helix region